MRRTKEARLAWEEKIWSLRCRGWTQREIASQLGVNQSSVWKVLRKLSRRIAQQMEASILERKAEQVAQLEQIAMEAMQGWERSKEAAHAVQERRGEEGISRTTSATGPCGDPAFLMAAIKALAEERKILDAGEAVPLVGEGGSFVWQQHLQRAQHDHYQQQNSPYVVVIRPPAGWSPPQAS
jgi:transcriptional regulator with XRE-family HTH domain